MLKKSLQTFRPYYVNECEDIKFAIKQVSSQFGMDADGFDFELQSVVTYKKNLYDYESQLIPLQEEPQCQHSLGKRTSGLSLPISSK